MRLADPPPAPAAQQADRGRGSGSPRRCGSAARCAPLAARRIWACRSPPATPHCRPPPATLALAMRCAANSGGVATRIWACPRAAMPGPWGLPRCSLHLPRDRREHTRRPRYGAGEVRERSRSATLASSARVRLLGLTKYADDEVQTRRRFRAHAGGQAPHFDHRVHAEGAFRAGTTRGHGRGRGGVPGEVSKWPECLQSVTYNRSRQPRQRTWLGLGGHAWISKLAKS